MRLPVAGIPDVRVGARRDSLLYLPMMPCFDYTDELVRAAVPVWLAPLGDETVALLLALGAALVLLVWIGYRLRVRDIRARNRQLERKIDEHTWALGQQKRALEAHTEQLERQRQELQALYQADEELHHHLHLDDVLRALVNIAVDLLHADKSAVLAWDKSQACLVMRVARGYSAAAIAGLRFARGELYAGRVLETGQPLMVEDTAVDPRTAQRRTEISQVAQAEEVRSLMHLPIQIGDEVFGVFNVSYIRPHAFGEDEVRLATALAQRAALAIDAARHFDAEQRRADQLQLINEIGRRIAALLDTEQIINQVVRLVQHTFGYYHVGIGLIEDDAVVYRAGAGKLWDDPAFEFKPQRLQVGKEGITGWVAAHGQSALVPDVAQDPRYVWMQMSGTRSEVVVPLFVQDQVIGVLDVQSDQVNAFDTTDLTVLEAIARQVGAAIENARLYARAQELAVMQERNRLARDLHDAVTQTLFSASLLADALPASWEKDPAEGRQLAHELRQLTRGALAEMRTLLLELRPAALVETKLGDLLRQLADAVAGRAGLTLHVEATGDCKLSAEAHIAFYRIAQEALNNIAKHARATRATLQLTCGERAATLVVRDDGRGFAPSQVSAGRIGLASMRERAQAIGAVFELESAPGEGTRIRVTWEKQESAG